MKLLFLLLAAGLAMSAVASADISNDEINARVGDDHHHDGNHDHDNSEELADGAAPHIVDRARGGFDSF
jgi:hypothetical protein